MSSLNFGEKIDLENLFRMESGYVLNFSDRTIQDFVFEVVKIDIHSEKYTKNGTSKANKLRTLWLLEEDYVVGKLVQALIDYAEKGYGCDIELATKCRQIAARLLSGPVILDDLKEHARNLNASYLAAQIQRMENAVEVDTALTIGTAKELIETTCKTILNEQGIIFSQKAEISELTKAVLKGLRLVPDDIPDAAKGADEIRLILQNLNAIGNNIAKLRNHYGTGHGKDGRSKGLSARHARLAVGAASTFVRFLFETHAEYSSKTCIEATMKEIDKNVNV